VSAEILKTGNDGAFGSLGSVSNQLVGHLQYKQNYSVLFDGSLASNRAAIVSLYFPDSTSYSLRGTKPAESSWLDCVTEGATGLCGCRQT